MNGIEKSIARAVASALIAEGHKISVDFERGYDCDDAHRDLTDLDAIIAAADQVEECWFVLDAERDGGGAKATNGWVYFIWGNGEEGRTCVSDYTSGLEPLLAPVFVWAEHAEMILLGQPERGFRTYHDAAQYLIGRGWTETNAGFLDGKGKVATIMDRKNDMLMIERHFTIKEEPCDSLGRPVAPEPNDAKAKRLAIAYAQLETTARDLLGEISKAGGIGWAKGEIAALDGALGMVERAKAEG